MNLLNAEMLRRLPLRDVEDQADKEARGRLLIVGGSRRVPGAPLLAGLAALRAGAGKVQLAIPRSLAPAAGASLMEAGFQPLPETPSGEIDCDGLTSFIDEFADADVLLVGPGIMDAGCGAALAACLLENLKDATFVLDAFALTGLGPRTHLFKAHPERIVITPHLGEMAAFKGASKEDVRANPVSAARTTSERLKCTTVLKGSETIVTLPDAQVYVHRLDNPGLATAGSGDVLAGVLAGLLARGNSPLTASLWAVHAHAQAGARLAEIVGRVGFLAHELLEELPRVLSEPAE